MPRAACWAGLACPQALRRGGPVALPAWLPPERLAGGWWLAGEGLAMGQRRSQPF